jgi:hypothetical protein
MDSYLYWGGGGRMGVVRSDRWSDSSFRKTVFRDMTICSLAAIYRLSEEGAVVFFRMEYFSTLQVETGRPFETLIGKETARCYNPQHNCHDNLKFPNSRSVIGDITRLWPEVTTYSQQHVIGYFPEPDESKFSSSFQIISKTVCTRSYSKETGHANYQPVTSELLPL